MQQRKPTLRRPPRFDAPKPRDGGRRVRRGMGAVDALDGRFFVLILLFNHVRSPHNSVMGFIALPKGGILIIYDLRDGAPVMVADTGFGVGRHADDTLSNGRFPVVVRQHTSASEDTLAVIYYRQGGAVVLFDMATGERQREIPTPPDVCPQSVVLVGTRLFVGGEGWLGEYDLAADLPRWDTIARPSFNIDKLAFRDSRLWAASDRYHPAHLEAFAAGPPDGQNGEDVIRDLDPTLEDFAFSDTHLAVVMRPKSQGRQLSAPHVFLYDSNDLKRPRIEVRTPGQELHVDRVNLLGDLVFAAGRMAGLCVAKTSSSAGNTLEWAQQIRSGRTEVIDVICCEVTRRVFAVTHGAQGVSHVEVCPATLRFLEDPTET